MGVGNIVKEFAAKAGHHDTTVHENVAPAVTQETINRQKHEEVTTAIDKEVHQDHYHTSVQPVKDREVLPEQHHQNIVGLQEKVIDHDDRQGVADRLKQEASKFRNTTERGDTTTTQSVAPTVAGEHIHHHVHETIQPVVDKQVIEPHVVHTTVPIHEVHHNKTQHHGTSALPAVSMSDFKSQGGVLGGREERYDEFKGEPRGFSSGGAGSTSATSTTGRETLGQRAEDKLVGGHHSNTTSPTTATGTTGLGSSATGHHSTGTSGLGASSTDRRVGGTDDTPLSSTSTDGKPGLMDKIKDAVHKA